MIEYEARVQEQDLPARTVNLIGKTRVRRFGKEGYRLQQKLWQAGFDAQSPDGISVPEPIGIIPRFQMWLQRKVTGPTATQVLPKLGGVELARRVADLIHKLHQTNISIERKHTIADELRILHDCLGKVAAAHSNWSDRLSRIIAACDSLGASLPEPGVCGIHRDFYPAQIVVATDAATEGLAPTTRLYLIDFDLYCMGDPGLDVGNFVGHMTEQALREFGDARALTAQEQALEDRFIELAGESLRPSVKAYTILTLVRHIYLSDQLAGRQAFTAALLELCEKRLGLLSADSRRPELAAR